MKRFWLLLFLLGVSLSLRAGEELTVTLVFKGVQKKQGVWVLWFADKKNVSYFFNAQKSNTEPYVFYTTGVDGGLRENEKIKGSWFEVTYASLRQDKSNEKIILTVKAIPSIKS